jgi:E3 ubiquitin-protein ligase Topors
LLTPGISSVLLDRLLHLLPFHEILSRKFSQVAMSYLHRHCDHFIQEFYNFARSPYDMTAFDRNAVYTTHTNTRVCVIIRSFISA